jgi:hypothetical protein
VPFVLDGCFCDRPINLQEAHAPAIRLTGCQLLCVAADQLETRGNLVLSRSTAAIVSLQGVHLGGNLILDATTLAGGSWPLNLAGVSLGPRTYAENDRRDHIALVASGLSIDGDVFCRHGFTAHGQVWLVGANVGRQLIFDGPTLNKHGAPLHERAALFADRLNVGQNLFCRNAETQGGVRLRAAHVAGQLVFDRTRLSNEHGEALDVSDPKAGSVWLRFAEPPVGGIDLAATRLGRLVDSEATWPSRLRLRGCVYGSVQATEDTPEQPGGGRSLAKRVWTRVRPQGPPDVQRRLQWIVLAEEGQRAEQSRVRRVSHAFCTWRSGPSPPPNGCSALTRIHRLWQKSRAGTGTRRSPTRS